MVYESYVHPLPSYIPNQAYLGTLEQVYHHLETKQKMPNNTSTEKSTDANAECESHTRRKVESVGGKRLVNNTFF